MSLLQQVQRGRSQQPPRILVYGTEGVGKSSLAATTPKPIFIQTEDGLGEIEVLVGTPFEVLVGTPFIEVLVGTPLIGVGTPLIIVLVGTPLIGVGTPLIIGV